MGRVFFDTRKNVHELTADYQCLASDSGKTFVLNSTSAMTVTLPTDANALIGWNCKFIVKTENDNTYTIFSGDNADSGGDDFVGGLTLAVAGVSSTSNGANGRFIAPAADDCNIVLDGNGTNTAGSKGSYVNVIKLTANEWNVDGIILTDDTTSDGTGLFTDTD